MSVVLVQGTFKAAVLHFSPAPNQTNLCSGALLSALVSSHRPACTDDNPPRQGRSQDLVSGGGATHFGGGGGGPDPLFFASDPKSQGSPLMYFWLPPDFGGARAPPPPPPPPGYALVPADWDPRTSSSSRGPTAALPGTPSTSTVVDSSASNSSTPAPIGIQASGGYRFSFPPAQIFWAENTPPPRQGHPCPPYIRH